MNRRILSLMIKCPEQACGWRGEIRDIENHEDKCDYKVVDCDNEDCSVREPRREMVRHVQDECLYRIVSCPHCNDTCTFCLLQVHIDKCPKCPVSCPNECEETMTREEITSHTLNECPLTIVPCSYQYIGCNFTVQRKFLNDHIEGSAKQHLTMATEKILTIQNQTTIGLESMQKQMDEMKSRMEDMKKQILPTIAIQDVQNQIDEMKKQILPTKVIQDVQNQIDEIKKQIAPINSIQHVQNQIDELKKQVLATSDVQDTQKQIDDIKKQIPPTNAIQDVQNQIDEIKKQTLHTNTIQDVQNVVDENPQTMATDDEKHYSYIWKVEDFRQQLQTAKQTGLDIQLYSEPFYTHRYGYRVKLRLNPNGFGGGKGTYVSVYIIVMRGEYDGLLTWPFDWKFKFILMDQKPDHSKRKNIESGFHTPDKSLKFYQRPTTDENIPIGFPKFFSQEALANNIQNYVVHDALFVKLELKKCS